MEKLAVDAVVTNASCSFQTTQLLMTRQVLCTVTIIYTAAYQVGRYMCPGKEAKGVAI